MTSSYEVNNYGPVAKALHWAAALCVVLAWGSGSFIEDFPKRLEPAVLFTHISLGLAVLALVFVRLGWRTASPPPVPLQTSFSPWAERLATLMQWALYILMVAGPLTGIALIFARGQALPVFGLSEIASPWARDRALARSIKEVHELMANTILVLATLHAAAALAHHYILRDSTLLRMLPGRGRPVSTP